MLIPLLVYLILMNAAGLLLMLADKRKARKKKWRIPESILLSVAALGGSVGCIYAMRKFHHKTRHPEFSIGLPIIFILQIILFVTFIL